MKTIIEFEDGTKEEHDGLAPSVDPESGTIGLVDEFCGCCSDEMPFSAIKRVIFEPRP